MRDVQVCFWQCECATGPSINYVGRREGGGLAKCLCYYISLCSKLAYVLFYEWSLFGRYGALHCAYSNE